MYIYTKKFLLAHRVDTYSYMLQMSLISETFKLINLSLNYFEVDYLLKKEFLMIKS